MSEDSNAKKKIEDLSSLTPEERIQRRREELERTKIEAEAKRKERLAREAEEARQRQIEEEARRREEEARQKEEAIRRAEEEKRLAEQRKREEEERRREEERQRELEKQRQKEEIKRLKKEQEEKKRQEQEAFYAQFGLTPDGKPLEPEEEHEKKEDQEEDATRRFALDELDFAIDVPGEEEEDQPEEVLESFAPETLVELPPELYNQPHLETCNFCRIHKGKLKPQIIYESDHVLVFLDPKPIHRGQMIIMPKGHFASLTECPRGLAQEILDAARLASEALKQASFDSPAVSLYVSESIDIPHDERHIYMSVIPRRPHDGVTIKFGDKDKLEKAIQQETALELKKLCQANLK